MEIVRFNTLYGGVEYGKHNGLLINNIIEHKTDYGTEFEFEYNCINDEDRFIVFGFDSYYPSGGCDDIEGVFSTKEEAERYIKDIDPMRRRDYYQIYSVELRSKIII